MRSIHRREFLELGLAAGAGLALGRADPFLRIAGAAEPRTKVIILGLDGMDPGLCRRWMDDGTLPALSRLRREGGFWPLITSTPPQSPVAWANFITGMDPGGHGIFDFTHRDPSTYLPVFSASKSTAASLVLPLGRYRIPLAGDKVENLLRAPAFWQHLEESGIPATIFKMPSNYPPVPSKQRTLSGMNTPDLQGTYGLFSFYTTEPSELDEDIGGGRIYGVQVVDHRVEGRIPGPRNTLLAKPEPTGIDFRVYLDPEMPVAKFEVQDEEFILQEGEWSRFQRVRFPLGLMQSVPGICRFYLKQVRPVFQLYVSPVNIDPAEPALPISTPDDYAQELAERFGPFYTQGLPGDFKALKAGILDEEEFLAQDDLVLAERKAMFEYEIERFEAGVLFYYVSSTDQRSHMFYRFLDEKRSDYDPALAQRWSGVIRDIYVEADRMVDQALQKADRDTVVFVVSDHGFTPFRRGFNLNTWLLENGYHQLRDRRYQKDTELFQHTAWSSTRAYGYGLNGLYLNLRGREARGSVAPGEEAANLRHELCRRLEAYRDPVTGEQVVLRAYPAEEVYSAAQRHVAPDIVLGFAPGYRISWSSPLGRMPAEVMENNDNRWSGDHCVCPDVVPGILACNRPIRCERPAFTDVAPTLLRLYGIPIPPEMVGRPMML